MRGLSVRLLLFVCLLASTAQGFVAQTHVHALPGAAAVAFGTAGSPVADTAAPEEQACVLCQVAGHTPVVAPPAHHGALPPPVAVHETPDLDSTVSFTTVASHHWRGRGPPTV